jgi:3-oxoacyl-[acyl-carrier-protein] synthase-3
MPLLRHYDSGSDRPWSRPDGHGELRTHLRVISTSGICLSGITALKYACMNVALALSDNAVATGSELASSLIRANFFEHLKGDGEHERIPVVPFESEFLRWMVSDAAGAVFLSRSVNSGRKTLRVDWIDHISYASRLETCMYAGGMKNEMIRHRLEAVGWPAGGTGKSTCP